jgi:uncharacterized protein DUF4349
MRKQIGLRNFGLVALAVIAIGAVAVAASNGGNGGSDGDEAAMATDASGGAVAPEGGSGLAGNFGKAPSEDVAAEEAPQRGSAAAGSAGAPAGGPAGAPAGGPATPGGSLVSTIERKIVSTASMQMQVENVGGSFGEVERIASSVGGFVSSSTFTNKGEDQIATVTIRVPSESYQSVLASLRNLAVEVDLESSDAHDVTEEYTDLGSRLRTLEATEAQLLTLLGRAETISDILTVQDRLNFTRGEIEQVKGRMQLLDDLTSLATITVHLFPAVAGGGGPDGGEGVDLGAEVAEAWDESIEFLGEVAAGVLTVVVFAWWVPVVGLPLLIAYKAVSRHREATELGD